MIDNNLFKILYGYDFVPLAILFSKKQYFNAKHHAKKVIKFFKKNDLPGGLSYIENIASPKIVFFDKNQAIYNARIVADKLSKIVYKKRFQDGKCLKYSMAIGAALSYLGFDFDFIIGQQLNRMNRYKYHAWIEINGFSINGRYNYKDIHSVIYKKSF